jgi:hypothetical protein
LSRYTACPQEACRKKALKEGFFELRRPFIVLPRTSLTTFVAVRHSGDHESLHIIYLLPNRDRNNIAEAQNEIITF